MELDRELEIYSAKLPELLEQHEGEFVLIYGETVAGFFCTHEDAVDAGRQRFGLVPFLVKQVLAVEPLCCAGGATMVVVD
jgi:hypothetical protein